MKIIHILIIIIIHASNSLSMHYKGRWFKLIFHVFCWTKWYWPISKNTVKSRGQHLYRNWWGHSWRTQWLWWTFPSDSWHMENLTTKKGNWNYNSILQQRKKTVKCNCYISFHSSALLSLSYITWLDWRTLDIQPNFKAFQQTFLGDKVFNLTAAVQLHEHLSNLSFF